jgi:hypothetical protein
MYLTVTGKKSRFSGILDSSRHPASIPDMGASFPELTL